MKSSTESKEQQQTQQQKKLASFMRTVLLTPTQMANLICDEEKFTIHIIKYNQMGINEINNEDYNQALSYLQEAQKLLEYAASCGKTIDRILITSTLQNQACAYQRLWELQKSSNYMEAIIYNMNSYLEHGPQPDINLQSYSNPQFYETVSLFVRKRLSLAIFYLKFSAVCSQTKKHEIALKNVYKALQTIQLICFHCLNYEKYIKKQNATQQSSVNTVLQTLASLNPEFDVNSYEKYLKQTKRSIAKLRYKLRKNSDLLDKNLQALHEFTIGQVMQINPISIEEMNKKSYLKDEITTLNKIYKVYYVSICFFAIATEMRLLSTEKYTTQSERKQSLEYKKSQIYHLKSIYVTSLFSPCESLYLEHIIKSYKNHYNVDLNEGSTLVEVSSIDIESQNCIDIDKCKIKDSLTCNLTNAQVREQLKLAKKEKTVKLATFQSEKCLEKVQWKKKKKKHILTNRKSSKPKQKIKSKTKGVNSPLLSTKKIESPPVRSTRGKSSLIHLKLLSQDKRSNKKQRVNSKSKSANKNIKNSQDEKLKKKNTKLHQEYFIKKKKKVNPKCITSHSLKKLKMTEYGGQQLRGIVHTISISKTEDK